MSSGESVELKEDRDVGCIGGESESRETEWKIPNFLSLRKFFSPSFSLWGCTWYIEAYWCAGITETSKGIVIRLYLEEIDPQMTGKTVTCAFGVQNSDGRDEWKSRKISISQKNDDYFIMTTLLNFDESYDMVDEEGTLTITCRMNAAEPKPHRPSKLKTLEILSSDLRDLLDSERKCDVTLIVQGREFRAHRAVLSARSPVFRAAYEHDSIEEQTGIMKIPDCDPDTFGQFLTCLYTGRIEDEEFSFQTALHLYTTADKYDVKWLKDFCTDYLRENLTAEHVCDVVILAEQHADDALESSSQAFFRENFFSVFSTPEWTAMMKDHLRLADKLVKNMASEKLSSDKKEKSDGEKNGRIREFSSKIS